MRERRRFILAIGVWNFTLYFFTWYDAYMTLPGRKFNLIDIVIESKGN